MSEEIDLDANNLSIPEDTFEKFQSSAMFEDDDYITLSDIVPPQPPVPDLSHELNEIPYDNEVVLGSPQTDERQVNSHKTELQLLNISENNVYNECRLDVNSEEHHNDDISSDLDVSNSRQKQQNEQNFDRQDLSSDGLGAQNYVIEDSTPIIQDSLLSTTVNQLNETDGTIETPSEPIGELSYPRRTKRGRIPNTLKYPMTSASDLDSNKITPAKRRPGRPKKVPLVQTAFEPDSTNENGNRTDSSGLDESTSNSEVKKRGRGRPKSSLKEDSQPTPRKRGRKPKARISEEINSSHLHDNTVESSKLDVDSQMELDSPLSNNNDNSLTSSTSKRKKGKKINLVKKSENVALCDDNDLDDDADDICLSQLKQVVKENENIQNSDINMSTDEVPNEVKGKPFAGFQLDSENKLPDDIRVETQSDKTNDVTNETVANVTVIESNVDLDNTSGSNKRNSKMPILSDFEYNVDKVVKEAYADGQTYEPDENECLLVEDTSKRRRTAKKTFVYDEGSDEDPFANVESSEDESPRRRKKGTKYYSDDEYVPREERKKGGGKIQSSSSESEGDLKDELDELDELPRSKKKGFGFSPFKKGRKPKNLISTIVTEAVDAKTLISTINPKAEGDDIEGRLETTLIKIDMPPAEAWATSNAFENFIAQKTQGNSSLKIKKVSSKETTEALAPLEIPVIKQNEPKKTFEMGTQTKNASTASISVQTSAPYDIPMKTNINLTLGQSEKACEFLSSVVKTTVELGQLMSQKSNDFMKKKINTTHVTDTFKMDYCVRKSFLLFKLAKHNLLQMEEDLANQYEAFLKEHKLSICREQQKKIVPKAKDEDDSDCEIVEVLSGPGPSTELTKKQDNPKFNPKTVFLNKELSIKIAKKASAPEKPTPGKKKLELKGRHAVWINKNVMVKKVTPTQSFLAQDSRNKKPPDTYVTEKMVSDFFEEYDRMKALAMCAPFINSNISSIQRQYACYYFVNESDAANTSRINNADSTEKNVETPDENINDINNIINPKSLFSLCIEAIRQSQCVENNQAQATQKLTCNVTDGTDTNGPVALFRLCFNILRADHLSQHKTQAINDTVEVNNLLDPEPKDNIQITECITANEMKNWSDQEIDMNEEGNVASDMPSHNTQVTEERIHTVSPLTTICYQNIVKMLYESATNQETSHTMTSDKKYIINIDEENMSLCQSEDSTDIDIPHNGLKSLITLCVELIQSLQGLPRTSTDQASISSSWHTNVCGLKTLKTIAFESIKHILYPICIEDTEPVINMEANYENERNENFTINCVNTLSEEVFQSIQLPSGIRIRKQSQGSSNFSDGYDNNDCGHDEMDFNTDHDADDDGWASQLQMQELRSCFTPHVDTSENITENNEMPQEEEPLQSLPQIKSEPIDYFTEENIVDTSVVKTEPIQALSEFNEMTHIPDNIITKSELTEATHDRDESPLIQSSYNGESFEQFVRQNKMIQFMDEDNGEIFSQSGLRIRRQHEPDVDQGNDTSMSLLVPHTFEPLDLIEAKGSLMETSSDDNDGGYKKSTGKKKDKKKKKTKKDAKAVNNKETSVVKDKEKTVPENEVALLTRRMREKIRQEEKKIVSSDSDSETLYMLSSKKDKSKKDQTELESPSSETENLNMLSSNKDETVKEIKKQNDKIKPSKSRNSRADIAKENKQNNDEVQCNNVDSTEKGPKKTESKKPEQFSGFTAIDQNEMTNYQKLMQFVYDKIVPTENENTENENPRENEPTDSICTEQFLLTDEPVELLECEPTMPIFDDDSNDASRPKKTRNKVKQNSEIVKEKPIFADRHGWQCYPIDPKETKLYKNVQIKLEKLPESFVKTYMEYQDVMDKDLDDREVDRLINLQSLNRSISIKDGKIKSRPKGSREMSNSGQNSENISIAPSPTYSDNFDELPPSDDEGPAVEDENPPPMPARSSENNLAKNLLMDDHDSDSDGDSRKKIKQESKDPDNKVENPKRPGPKSKIKEVFDKADSESLMLTADKMMNKELALLHAPVVLQNDVKAIPAKETSPKEESKSSKRSSTKHTRDRIKNDDDSSSEEEKQWVSTKEKLLKRMGKKEDAIADDAKRAKLVNEFIERRNEDRKDKRESCKGRKGRARRKMLERQKQLRFLSKELSNEGDGVTTGKRGAAAGLFKGRRNIRKVIDKKSLARSTVVANMEEFERKRRLNMRQNKLREVLGCEEGVNVLVINDEVCLEYDFKEQRPVVSVHQFFTKVMKAHQYEGVKFMWDACFESLATIESGHGGGGCILAHCMGLGKTLQVLALLHTVLTHPRANMHRVLVCCPLSTVLNWVDEIHKWIGPVTHEIKVFELSKLRKTYERAYQLEDWYNGGGIFIIGYELFRSLTTLDPEIDEIRPTIINKIRTALLDPGPDIIVCDEGHLLKNDCSVLAVAMSRVVTKRRIVLTGTPMQNNLREYFCMVNFIKPNLLGTYSEYSNRFENPIMNGQHRDSVVEDIKLMKARTHILHKVLEGCLQRQEASVLYPYLPKKHEYTVFIPLTKCQWDLYNHYLDNYAKTSKQSVLRDFHILQKIWSHPQVLHSFQMKARDKKDKIKAEKIEDDLALADQEADIKPAETEVWWLQYLGEGAMLDSLDSSNKFVAVFRILQECIALGDKVLIFSTSLFCLDALEFFLKKINKWSLGQEYYRLDGSVPAEVRQKWCREFNAENNIKTQLFLISTRAGCLGLNMTAANRVIILDTSWNPAHDIQSIFRVYRFGQKKDCYIYRLVALGTMEQKIYERSVTKQAVACRVVDEQQIDRHYNLAELTELYSVDEMGLSVAGGVAVGVGDVALLRVARDAAIHAVHEHDSLLRGSGEQGLPEHERAAAWNQFQQEHEHKQMQNDLNANKAVVALKRLEMEHLRQQALYSTTQAPIEFQVKTEPFVDNYPPQVPKEEPVPAKKGRKIKNSRVVQCRIPISSDPQPGLSTIEPENQNELVGKITSLLIKYDFMQNKSGPKEVSELVAKVKKMVATREPIALGPGYDELSASIAEVLISSDVSKPHTKPPISEEPTKLPSKKSKDIQPVPMDIPEPDGRRRRKAALVAEMHFDAQKDIIDLDDDGDDWQNDTLTVDDEVVEPVKKPQEKKQKTNPTPTPKPIEMDSSIVLSDDEPTPQVSDPPPQVVDPPLAVPATLEDTEIVPLHPSLLTNSNFIKIVAHTYLAGNPKLDEDAATLAAQYSTLKTLKEAESEGKLIESGAVYDIAVKVLGKEVLRKLQAANPITSVDSSSASTKLQSVLKGNLELEKPAAAVKKPKIGPKSKVAKDVKQEQIESRPPSTTINQMKKIQTTRLNRVLGVTKALLASGSFSATNVSAPREESILPDKVVISTPEAVEQKPIMLRRVKLERKLLKASAPAIPVSMGRGPAPQAPPQQAPPTSNTICLDSDEESAEPPPERLTVQLPSMTVMPSNPPVPVALTSRNAQPIPLPLTPQPTYYTMSPCGTHAIRLSGPPLVPLRMGGPGAVQPVPGSLRGSDPAQMSFGPIGGFQKYTVVGQQQPVPGSYVGPDLEPVPVSLSGPGLRAGQMTSAASAPQPVPMSLIDSSGRPIAFPGGNPSQAGALLYHRITTQGQSQSHVASTPSTSSALPPPAQLRPAPPAPLPAHPTAPTNNKNKPADAKGAANILNFKLGASVSNLTFEKAPKPAEPAAPLRPAHPTTNARRDSSSTSSSSGRSRSSSPDPLAILKDVVHIQAPSKPTHAPPSKPTPQKPASSQKSSNLWQVKASPTTKAPHPPPATTYSKTQAKGKISSSIDLTATSQYKAKVSATVDLTSAPNRPGRPKTCKDSSGSKKMDLTKAVTHGKLTSQAKPGVPSKLVGTSKNIILDGISKSLKVENKTNAKNQNQISRAPRKQILVEKRPAPSSPTPALKKKKTDLMTLKDFDIDDIDGIIELD